MKARIVFEGPFSTNFDNVNGCSYQGELPVRVTVRGEGDDSVVAIEVRFVDRMGHPAWLEVRSESVKLAVLAAIVAQLPSVEA